MCQSHLAPTTPGRRHFPRWLYGLVLLAGCLGGVPAAPRPGEPRLHARPTLSTRTLDTGITRTMQGGTEIVAYLPTSAALRDRVPVFVFLHGANRVVEPFVDGFRPLADSAGVLVVAPYAAVGTWDAIRVAFGPDVQGLDRVLAWVFSVVPVDPSRIVLAGFSDGATYTLAIGRANGDLFTRLVAFSPGFAIAVDEIGKPPIVISHGTDDQVLPFANTRDVIVPGLKARGYDVEFVSFSGPHAVSLSVARTEFRRLGSP